MVRSSLNLRRWTAEEDTLLMQLLERREALPVIAAQLKRTMSAVETRASFLRARAVFRNEQAKTGR